MARLNLATNPEHLEERPSGGGGCAPRLSPNGGQSDLIPVSFLKDRLIVASRLLAKSPFIKHRSSCAIQIALQDPKTNSAISRCGDRGIQVSRLGSLIPLKVLSFL